MAYTFTRALNHAFTHHTIVAEWLELSNVQTDPEFVVIAGHTDVTVQLLRIDSGTPTVIVEGSLNLPEDSSKVWFPLTDPGNVAISWTSAGGEQVLHAPFLIRPRVSSGTGAATVRMKATRQYGGY